MSRLLLFFIVLALSGCLLERVAQVDRNLAPYGAHWFKAGMTKESRRLDLLSCGSSSGEVIEFSQDQIHDEKRSDEPNGIGAYLRLRDKIGSCMRVKAYTPVGDLHFLGGCDARCLYP